APVCNTDDTCSCERLSYNVDTRALILNEYDNGSGGEVLLWSNPLTNSLDSTNWTLVFGMILQAGCPTLPVVTTNYDNSFTNYVPATSQDSPYVFFGKPVNEPSADGGIVVPQSATM